MIPPLIVREALGRNIHLIAITDHNATANIWAVQKAAEGTDLVVLPGMEVQTAEEVHCVCLFDTLDQANSFQSIVDAALPAFMNDTDLFGEQFIVDETGDFIRREERLLLTSTHLTIEQAWKHVSDLGGLFIPAHVNRKAFGLIENLGMVPADLPIEALEISRHIRPEEARKKFPQIAPYPLIQAGDVHYLADFLGPMAFYMEKPSISELRLALQAKNGRSYQILEPDDSAS